MTVPAATTEGPCQPPRDAIWQAFLQSQSESLQAAGLWRTIEPLEGAPGPTVRIGGQELLLLCSNNYLGLATDRRLIAAATAAAQQLGVGSGASRLLGGTLALHEQLERRLAALKGCEDCVLFGSGYLANVGTLAALLQPGDTVVSDRLNHASIIDGCRLSGAQVCVYPHRDVAAAAQLIERASGRVLIVTDSVFSMDGDGAPLQELHQLATQSGALLMVDEAHATGVLGNGLVAHCGLHGQIPVVMGTCSKALGSVGGFIAGSKLLCGYLRQRARTFFFDTALPPPTVAATLAALDVIALEPERGQRARELAQRLYLGLRELGFAVHAPIAAIVPVIFGESQPALAAAAQLRAAGILAPAIRPPTVPAGTARIRLCTMATHTDADIAHVLHSFAQLPRNFRLPAPR